MLCLAGYCCVLDLLSRIFTPPGYFYKKWRSFIYYYSHYGCVLSVQVLQCSQGWPTCLDFCVGNGRHLTMISSGRCLSAAPTNTPLMERDASGTRFGGQTCSTNGCLKSISLLGARAWYQVTLDKRQDRVQIDFKYLMSVLEYFILSHMCRSFWSHLLALKIGLDFSTNFN